MLKKGIEAHRLIIWDTMIQIGHVDSNEIKDKLKKFENGFLVRQIVLCMEETLIEKIRTKDVKYRGQTFMHLYFAAFSSNPKYPFSNDDAKNVYLDFLSEHAIDDEASSWDFAVYTKKLKAKGNSFGHYIPPKIEQEKNIDQYKNLITGELWLKVIDIATKLARENHKDLIY